MIAPSHDSPRRSSGRVAAPTIVKYSLTELLEEVEIEKTMVNVGIQKVAQTDIAKLFQTQSKRRRGQSRS